MWREKCWREKDPEVRGEVEMLVRARIVTLVVVFHRCLRMPNTTRAVAFEAFVGSFMKVSSERLCCIFRFETWWCMEG